MQAGLPLLVLLAVSGLGGWWWFRFRPKPRELPAAPGRAAPSINAMGETGVSRYLRQHGLGLTETGVARYLRGLDPASAANSAETGVARYLRDLGRGTR